jgi:RAB protein geranylgeranyltransferase component A
MTTKSVLIVKENTFGELMKKNIVNYLRFCVICKYYVFENESEIRTCLKCR